MRVYITGMGGQLGRALVGVLGAYEVGGSGRAEVDVAEGGAVRAAIQDFKPDVVINCAAYTNVDGCAKEPEKAYRVNGLGAQNVALACAEVGADLVHVSTNEVFGGTERGGYEEWMPLSPINGYGRSKAAGEAAVRQAWRRSYIVRTAWLYAPGGRNFIHAILRRARETGVVRVVTDEIGNPTSVMDLAVAIGELMVTKQYGTYHLVNEGACSRWAFANEILRLAGLAEVVNEPILGSEFKRASTPPRFGGLKNVAGGAIGVRLRPWEEALAAYMAEEGA
ncbi:MAG TPA: dTDP-4-dehydrorhamnose reductase [Anaerolineae bacterium]|nr:dTDP-4-dehydrorhamnose reductase [Anaerolineae bacterium]